MHSPSYTYHLYSEPGHEAKFRDPFNPLKNIGENEEIYQSIKAIGETCGSSMAATACIVNTHTELIRTMTYPKCEYWQTLSDMLAYMVTAFELRHETIPEEVARSTFNKLKHILDYEKIGHDRKWMRRYLLTDMMLMLESFEGGFLDRPTMMCVIEEIILCMSICFETPSQSKWGSFASLAADCIPIPPDLASTSITIRRIFARHDIGFDFKKPAPSKAELVDDAEPISQN